MSTFMTSKNTICKTVALLTILPLVFFTSCDPSVEYAYTIKNSTKETLQLKFDHYHYYVNTHSVASDVTENNFPTHVSTELLPGDEAMFSVILECTAYVFDDPEEEGPSPLAAGIRTQGYNIKWQGNRWRFHQEQG